MPLQTFPNVAALEARIRGSAGVLDIIDMASKRIGAVVPEYPPGTTFIQDPNDDRKQIPDPKSLRGKTIKDVGSRTRLLTYSLLVQTDRGLSETRTGNAFHHNPGGVNGQGNPETEQIIPAENLWALLKPPVDQQTDADEELTDYERALVRAKQQRAIIDSWDPNTGIALATKYNFDMPSRTFTTEQILILVAGNGNTPVLSPA